MEVAHFKAVVFAGLCISFAVKDWRFRGVFGGFEVPFGLLYGARVVVRIVVRVMEFSH
ncbi:MAG TPA: hypothetical protein VGR84_17055 [Candidatus Acidoferrales bacterium]|nr:hypothetical protein [Candidatus Acidoferrales bacterium]